MREIADEVGATLLVDMAHFAGLVAGMVLTGDFDPVQHAHVVTVRDGRITSSHVYRDRSEALEAAGVEQ